MNKAFSTQCFKKIAKRSQGKISVQLKIEKKTKITLSSKLKKKNLIPIWSDKISSKLAIFFCNFLESPR